MVPPYKIGNAKRHRINASPNAFIVVRNYLTLRAVIDPNSVQVPALNVALPTR